MDNRPPIPSEVKREVRRRCGYGCVVCGMPIFDYEHMVPYAQVRTHEAENLTLLCPNHHREKTAGLLPLRDVRGANENPFNQQVGQTSPYRLHFSGTSVRVGIGTNYFEVELSEGRGDVAMLAVDRSHVLGFSFEDGRPLLNLLTRSRDNRRLLRISRGEMTFDVAGVWDATFIRSKLVLRSANRKIDLVIWFDPANNFLLVRRGSLRLNGIVFNVDLDGTLRCVNADTRFRFTRFQNGACIHVGPPETVLPGYFNLGDLPRIV